MPDVAIRFLCNASALRRRHAATVSTPVNYNLYDQNGMEDSSPTVFADKNGGKIPSKEEIITFFVIFSWNCLDNPRGLCYNP